MPDAETVENENRKKNRNKNTLNLAPNKSYFQISDDKWVFIRERLVE